jgi:anti-sigma factor (TIGR02949 family)
MTRIPGEKVVAGLSCGDVLDHLSDYLDDELAAQERTQVEEHLRGCEGCARFGGELRATVRALKEHLTRAGGLPRGFKERLRKALDDDSA